MHVMNGYYHNYFLNRITVVIIIIGILLAIFFSPFVPSLLIDLHVKHVVFSTGYSMCYVNEAHIPLPTVLKHCHLYHYLSKAAPRQSGTSSGRWTTGRQLCEFGSKSGRDRKFAAPLLGQYLSESLSAMFFKQPVKREKKMLDSVHRCFNCARHTSCGLQLIIYHDAIFTGEVTTIIKGEKRLIHLHTFLFLKRCKLKNIYRS